jgi:hypothetical protein
LRGKEKGGRGGKGSEGDSFLGKRRGKVCVLMADGYSEIDVERLICWDEGEN